MEFLKRLKENRKTFLVIVLLTGFFGICLRLYAYFLNSSMWYDEVALALNVDENIFFPPLLKQQSAPFLFLIFAKICTFFSHSNFSFRFLPFISSIISILVFYFFLKHWIKSKTGIILALFVFCINFRLIYFTQEFKPYITDVLIFMLISIWFFKINIEKISPKKAFLNGAAFSLLPLISFPSIFPLAAIGLFYLSKIKKNVKNIILFLFPLFISLSIQYFLFFKNYASNEYLLNFWQNGFITFKTVIPVFFRVLDYFMTPFYANLFMIIMLIAGLILCFRQNKKETLFVLASFMFLILASILHKYPVQERLVLFLYPSITVFCFKVFDIKIFKTGIKNFLITFFVFLLSFGMYIKSDIKMVLDEKFYQTEPLENFLKILKKEHKTGEVIIPLPWSDVAFLHYNKKYKFDKEDFIIFKENHPLEYTKPFWNIPKGNYWLIFTISRDNYYRYLSLEEWLKRDFEVIKVYKDFSSRMYHVKKIR